MKPSGIKVAIYTAAGALDSTYTIKTITGGNITTTGTDCTVPGGGASVSLFTNKCVLPNGNLANNTQYNFKSDPSNNCNLPPSVATPGQYFSLNKITFNKNLPATPVRMDVTLYYACDGLCSTSPAVTETWVLKTP